MNIEINTKGPSDSMDVIYSSFFLKNFGLKRFDHTKYVVDLFDFKDVHSFNIDNNTHLYYGNNSTYKYDDSLIKINGGFAEIYIPLFKMHDVNKYTENMGCNLSKNNIINEIKNHKLINDYSNIEINYFYYRNKYHYMNNQLEFNSINILQSKYLFKATRFIYNKSYKIVKDILCSKLKPYNINNPQLISDNVKLSDVNVQEYIDHQNNVKKNENIIKKKYPDKFIKYSSFCDHISNFRKTLLLTKLTQIREIPYLVVCKHQIDNIINYINRNKIHPTKIINILLRINKLTKIKKNSIYGYKFKMINELSNIVNNNVKFRMGKYYDNKFIFPLKILGKDLLYSDHFMLLFNKNIYHLRNSKLENIDFNKCHSGLVAFADDSNAFSNLPNNCPILLYIRDSTGTFDIGYPVFNFHRHVTNNSLCIMHWDKCCDVTFYNTIWQEKKEKGIFIGSCTGRITMDNSIRTKCLFKNYLKNLCESFDSNTLDKTEILRELNKFPRYNLCYKYINSDLIDCGLLKPFKILDNHKSFFDTFMKNLTRGRMSKNDINKYKYQIVVEGNDFPTSLKDALSTNCVVLMPPMTFDCIYTFGLKEWVHYVPIKKDFSDIEDKIMYLKNNDEISLKISNNATEHMKQFSNQNIQTKINKEIFKRYMNNCSNIKQIVNLINDSFIKNEKH